MHVTVWRSVLVTSCSARWPSPMSPGWVLFPHERVIIPDIRMTRTDADIAGRDRHDIAYSCRMRGLVFPRAHTLRFARLRPLSLPLYAVSSLMFGGYHSPSSQLPLQCSDHATLPRRTVSQPVAAILANGSSSSLTYRIASGRRYVLFRAHIQHDTAAITGILRKVSPQIPDFPNNLRPGNVVDSNIACLLLSDI